MSLDRMTRRDALCVLGAAAAAMPLARAQGGALLHITRVDHCSLAVGDIDKAMIFYRRLFGNEVLKDNKTARRYLRLGLYSHDRDEVSAATGGAAASTRKTT